MAEEKDKEEEGKVVYVDDPRYDIRAQVRKRRREEAEKKEREERRRQRQQQAERTKEQGEGNDAGRLSDDAI